MAFVAALAAGLVYGVNMWRKRWSPGEARMRDNATRELYHHSGKE